VLEGAAAVCWVAGVDVAVEAGGAGGVSGIAGVEADGVSGAWDVDFVSRAPHASMDIKRIGRMFFMIV
jgi:hypothetical protein